MGARLRGELLGLRRKFRLVRRSALIWRCVFVQLCKTALCRRRFKTTPTSPEAVSARRKLAGELRDTLVRLGPTFIKVGQLLSTRVDVLPPEVIDELTRLQNDVPGFPAERAVALIKQELGKPPEELFASFERTPLAAASLAQVHRAKLKTGEEVVVKVQRENLKELFDIDLANIRLVAKLADRLDPQTEATSANWKGIADTSGEVLYREIDFNNERESAEEFAANFADFKAVKVPKMMPELSTSRLLTMEYCPGVKITDSERLAEMNVHTAELSSLLTTSYLEQICRHGFFHCDPHPGNLAVDNGHPGGRLIYYDFGMMERIEPEVKKGFVDLIFSIYENLPREACDALEAMGVLRPGIDRWSIERIAKDMLDTFAQTLSSEDAVWENEMTPEQKKASRRARRARLGEDLFATQAEKPFLFPPKFTFVFRAFSTIDGIGKNLNPAYDLTRISQPFLKELIDLRDGSATTTALKTLSKRVGLRPVDVAQVVTQPRSVAAMAKTIAQLEDGDLKLRVRALEVERALDKVDAKQNLIGASVGALLLYQISTTVAGVLSQRLVQLGALKLAWEARRAYLRYSNLDTQQKRFENRGKETFDEIDVF